MCNDPARSPHLVLLQEAHAWRLRHDIGGLTDEERSAFSGWLGTSEEHEAAYDRAVTLNIALDKLDLETLRPAARPQTQGFFPQRRTHWASMQWRNWMIGGMAAGALAFVAVLFVPQPHDTAAPVAMAQSYQTNPGQSQSIGLRDGSSVVLGPGSEIRIAYGQTRRDIAVVSGAALFDVAKDPQRPFTVTAGALKARAIGTVFDVRFNAGVSRVAVAEGRVRVSYPLVVNKEPSQSDVSRILNPGQQIAAVRQGLGKAKPIALDKVGAWQEGRVDYVSAPVAELVADVARHSNVSISIRDPENALGEKTVSGSFDLSSLDSLLEVLETILNIDVERPSENEIVLKSE